MSTEDPAWKIPLAMDLMDWLQEHVNGFTLGQGVTLEKVIYPHIKAAEQRGREAATADYVSRLKADWSRYRGSVLEEAWKAMRDAEGGPMIEAMQVINDLMDPQ